MGKTINWDAVRVIHRTIAGIYAQEGFAHSILVNTTRSAQYPNSVGPEEILYCLGSSTQPHGIKALLESVAKKRKIHVFQKVGVNEWRDLAWWVPVEVMAERNGFWPIRLLPSK